MNAPQRQQRPLSPHLQVYKFQYTMTLSILHRITGLLLSAASVFLVWWLWALASGAAAYEQVMRCLSGVWGRLLLIGILFCFSFHLANGIRHLCWDLGYGFEKRHARATGWIVVWAAVAMTIAGAYLALRLLGGMSPELGGEV